MFALRSPVGRRYHLGSLFRAVWGSKHSFHGNISETHIDKRIGAAVFLWWRMKPQKLRGFQRVNTIKRCQYIQEEGSTQAEESVWFLIMRQITNDSYLLFAKSSLWLCLPARLPACLPVVLPVCVRAATQMGNNFQLDCTLQMDILIRCSCSHQAAEKQSSTV